MEAAKIAQSALSILMICLVDEMYDVMSSSPVVAQEVRKIRCKNFVCHNLMRDLRLRLTDVSGFGMWCRLKFH